MGGKNSKTNKKDKNKNKWVPHNVDPKKYTMTTEKAYLYTDLFVKKKASEIQAKEADLARAMKLPARYRDDEISRAMTLVNDHKYLRAARIILKDCGVLRDLAHEVIAVQGELSRLPTLLPYIESVIWGARRLNLNQLKDLEQMVLETLGPDVLSKIDVSANIDQELRGLFSSDKPTANELNDYWNMFSVQQKLPIDVINQAGHGVNTFTPTPNVAATNLVAAPLVPIEPMKPRTDTQFSFEEPQDKWKLGALDATPPRVLEGSRNPTQQKPVTSNKVPAITVLPPGRGPASPGKRDTGLAVEQPLSPFTLSAILSRADKLCQNNNNKNNNTDTNHGPEQFLTAPGRMSTAKDSMSMYPQQHQFISNGKASSHFGFCQTPGQAKSGNDQLTAALFQLLEKEKSKYTEQSVFVSQAAVKRTVEREIDCHAGNVQAPLMAIPSWLDLTLQPYHPDGDMKPSTPVKPQLNTRFSLESIGSFQQEEAYQAPEPAKHPQLDALDNLVDSMAFTTNNTNN